MFIVLTLSQYLSSLNSSFNRFSSGLWQLFPKSIFSFHLYPSPNLPCTEATTLLLKPSNNSLHHLYFLKHPSSPVRLSPNSFTSDIQRDMVLPVFPTLIFHQNLSCTFCFCCRCSTYFELFPDSLHPSLLLCATVVTMFIL